MGSREGKPKPLSLLQREIVEMVITDFDGVHTDNTASVNEHGSESVRINRSDGLGVQLLLMSGVKVVILTSEISQVATTRAKKLGVPCIHGGLNKAEQLPFAISQANVDPLKTIYVGNDVNDLTCMGLVGISVAVSDAHPSVLTAADYVTRAAGGRGAVRELSDQILAHCFTRKQ